MATTRENSAQLFVIALIAIVLVAMLGVGSADADVNKVGGGAFGLQLKGLVSAGPTPAVTLPPSGGGPFSATMISLNVPAVLNTGQLALKTEGGNVGTAAGFAQSSAKVTGVSILAGLISADILAAQCRSTAAGSVESSSFVGLRVAGTRVTNFSANSTITIPGVARVVINEQIRKDKEGFTTTTTNALHVTLLNALPLLQSEIILAQAQCQASGPSVNEVPTTTTSTTTTTVHPFGCPCQLWDDATVPGTVDAGDAGADVELGVRFRSDVAGVVKAVRFYKSAANTGLHVGNLWSTTGQLLATANFTNESASGWQQANFTVPVPITAGTHYIASYHTTSGHYSFDPGYFLAFDRDSGPLHAPVEQFDNNNGVYKYGPSGPSAFPTSGNGGANYWVDLVFE